MEMFLYFTVTKQTTIDDLKRQWRDLSKKYHPDTTTDEAEKQKLEEKFKEVQAEYEKALKYVGKKSGMSAIEITSVIYNEMDTIFPGFENNLKTYLAEKAATIIAKADFIPGYMKVLLKPAVKKGISGFDVKKFIEDMKKEKQKG